MPEILIAIILVLFFIFLGSVYFLSRKIAKLTQQKNEDKTLLLLQNQLHEMTRQFNERMREHNQTLQEQMQKSNEGLQKQFGVSTKVIQDIGTQSTKIIKEVTEKLTKLDETNKRVVSFAEQIKSLENILKNPKQRGILGEILLENLLSTVFPPEYFKMQYLFQSDRKIVDAVLFFDQKIIPIDAKFSLELYNQIAEETDQNLRTELEKEFKQSLKIRIDETSKYVRPNETTTDFALMFIPADGIFYSILSYQVGSLHVNANNLIEYAFSKKVIIVSPMTLFAYLQTILQSMHKLTVSKNIEEIVKRIGQLGKHLRSYDTYLQNLGKSLETTVNKYNTAYTEFKKVDKDVYSITDGQEGGNVEPLQIDSPKRT